MKKISDYETLQAIIRTESPFLLYVSTPDCCVCRADYPRVEEMASRKNLPAYHIDAAEVPMAAGQLSLFTSPVVLLFYKGREYHRQARILDFSELDRRMDELAGGAGAL